MCNEKNLNRMAAACTRLTHEPLSQETLRTAKVNNTCLRRPISSSHNSWVDKNDPDLATGKARELMRSAERV